MFYKTRETVINQMIEQGDISAKTIEASRHWLLRASGEEFEEFVYLCTDTNLSNVISAIAQELQRYGLL